MQSVKTSMKKNEPEFHAAVNIIVCAPSWQSWKFNIIGFLVAHFPSNGSDDPPPHPSLGVENLKIRENSEKNQGTHGGHAGTLYKPF